MRLPCRDVRGCRKALGHARYLSQIDLKAGYYNVPLDPTSQQLTAFSTPMGTYYWTRMTQGLQNAPCWFQWVMEDVLRGLPVSVMLDDVGTADADLDANLREAGDVILRLTGHGAMVGLPKCSFGMTAARHLGDWWCSGGKFRPSPDKLAVLVQLTEEQLSSMPRA